MAYLFKQKINLRELAALEYAQKKVLLHQPEEYLASLYMHYLRFHNFDVKHCPNLAQLRHSSESFQPHALIFSLENSHPSSSIAWLLSFKKHFPNTVIVTTDMNTDTETLKKLLSAGVSSHINRRHSRPQDIATITKTLLNY
jgi:DNA-binding response OmpR family regulator